MIEQNKKFKLVSSKKTRYLLPNILTLAGVCLGISSIKFSIDGNFSLSVILILFAAILDALDGRVARLIKGTSDFVIGERMNLAGIYKNDSSNLNLEVYYGAPMKIFMMFTLKSGVDRNVDDTMGKEITYKTKNKIQTLCGDGKNEKT